ncbi:MAG: zinc ribbon domain-containing protein [Proteobacteria bacterium]|nr:zinc ribbon domain-containing protein [Pseudomonadota bacterium]
MIRCSSCGADCESGTKTCHSCGADPQAESRQDHDDEILVKDRWTFSGAVPTESKSEHVEDSEKTGTKPDDSHQAPSGAGYQGYGGRQNRFDMTMEIAKEPAEPDSKSPATQTIHVLRKPTPRSEEESYKKSGNQNVKLDATILGVAPVDPHIKTAPSSMSEGSKVRIESSAKLMKATAPQEVKLGLSPSRVRGESSVKPSQGRRLRDKNTPGAIAPMGSYRIRMGTEQRMSSSLSIGLGISSAILISTWFIPDVWSAVPVFPFRLISSTHGIDLIALLADPIFGALLLAMLIAPINTRIKAGVSLPIGLLALVTPLLIGAPALPFDGLIVLIIAAVNIVVAVVAILAQPGIPAIGQIILMLGPGTLFGFAIFGVITGRLPPAQLAIFKSPLQIYAAMLISAMAAASLLNLMHRED